MLGSASVPIADVRGPLDTAQLAMLDALGALLATSTAALVAAARDEAGAAGLVRYLLVYLPTARDLATPAVRRANAPPGWAVPALEVSPPAVFDWALVGCGGGPLGSGAVVGLRGGYHGT